MAEIKIKKKKPAWPWVLIIVILIILVLLYFFVFSKNDDDFDNSNRNNTEQIDSMDSTMNAVEDTVGWEDNRVSDSLTGGSTEMTSIYLSSMEEESKLGADAVYTNNALMKLIDAVEAKANESQLKLEIDLKKIRENTMEINADSTNSSSAPIKEAGNKIADAMQNIQEARYPQLAEEVNEVKKAVEHIDAKKKMDHQQKQISAFFHKSAEVLKQMN